MFTFFKTLRIRKLRYNIVITITFERNVRVRLSSCWLKKAKDDQGPAIWMPPNVFEELCRYRDTDEFKTLFDQDKKKLEIA